MYCIPFKRSSFSASLGTLCDQICSGAHVKNLKELVKVCIQKSQNH